MAKAKKTKKEVIDDVVKLEPIGEIKLAEPKKYEQCEWCFQFDEDEPQIFAWTDDNLDRSEDPKVIFTIANLENSYISFENAKTGKSFKLFARNLSDEGRKLREEKTKEFKL